ncbi:unnamed protein product [Camellia sinensis]
MCLKMADSQKKVFAAFWYSIIGRLLCTNSRKEDQKEEKSGVQIFDLQHFDLYSPHQPMSASLAFTTDAMRLLEEEQFLQLNKKEKDPLKPKQPMPAFFIFRNERRAESKCGWEVIEEWNNMTEKQKKPYEKIAKQNMEKYLEEMEAYKQRKEEGSANPKKEEGEMMKIHKQEALELLKKKEKTKENRQKKKKKIADPNKPKKPASSFLLFSGVCGFEPSFWNSACCNVKTSLKEARKNLLEERSGINDSTLNALISVKWEELSEKDKQTWNEKAAGAKKEQDIRVASQLFMLMDSNKPTSRSVPQVVVVAPTDRADAIDPALRRSGHFDTEIEVTTPNEDERFQILKLYTKKLPLDPSVDLRSIAASCNGYVGADLEALCRKAAMSAVRKSSDANEEAGMRSLTMDDWKHARSVLGPSITRGVTVEIPKVSWEDIGGLKNLKKKLQQAVEWPLKHSAAFSRLGVSPVCGILLHGPPGCSKTTLAKAAAHATQASFFSLRELYSMYVGEGEALLHNTFRRARLAAPSIIFFDEADVVAAKRGGKSSSNIAVGERLLSTLLTEMDGLEQAKGILVLAATNHPHAIDAALMRPGRFDQLFWGNDFDLKQIAEDTELFTGAELEGLCREAGIVALREDISASVVCNRHFQTVWKSLKPALTREEVNSYSSFMKNPSLISSGSSKASAKQNTRHTTSLLGSVGPVSIGILSFILLAGVKYFFMQTDRFPNELATT